MTQTEKIKASQQASLAKFAAERDLMIQNPQIKEFKAYLTDEIHLILEGIPFMEKRIEQYKAQMNAEQDYLKGAKRDLKRFAQSAYIAQQNGIFWADDWFTVKKPADPKIDIQAMLNSLTEEQKANYEIKTPRTVIDISIDTAKLCKEVPLLYTKTNPVIAKKTKRSGDLDDE
jgi:vancomycin resistance protein YoaR